MVKKVLKSWILSGSETLVMMTSLYLGSSFSRHSSQTTTLSSKVGTTDNIYIIMLHTGIEITCVVRSQTCLYYLLRPNSLVLRTFCSKSSPYFLALGLFPESQIPWLLDMLQNDIFGGASDITKDHFFQVSCWIIVIVTHIH